METVLCFRASTEAVSTLKGSVVQAQFLAACISSTAMLKFQSVHLSRMRKTHPKKDSSLSNTATIQRLCAPKKGCLSALIIKSGFCSKQVSNLILLYFRRLVASEWPCSLTSLFRKIYRYRLQHLSTRQALLGLIKWPTATRSELSKRTAVSCRAQRTCFLSWRLCSWMVTLT